MSLPPVLGREHWISLHDVARRLGVVLSNEQAWSIGNHVANRWEAIMNARPVKDNRVKKIGFGSHCFAIYPPTWAPVLEQAIKAVQAEPARQLELL